MSDGNTHAIDQHLDEREDWDALQEVTAELEQAEARIEELEAKLRKMALDCIAASGQAEEAYQAQLVAEAQLEHNKKLMLALAGDKIDLVSELAGVKAKLAKAIHLLDDALSCDGEDYLEWNCVFKQILELKGETE